MIMTTTIKTRKSGVMHFLLMVAIAVVGTVHGANTNSNSSSTSGGGSPCVKDSQCLNGGICESLEQKTSVLRAKDALTERLGVCSCRKQYSGNRCEIYCPLQCHNGGVCQLDNPDASSEMDEDEDDAPSIKGTCHCPSGFTGDLCEIEIETCDDGTVCVYGSECQSRREDDQEFGRYKCSCLDDDLNENFAACMEHYFPGDDEGLLRDAERNGDSTNGSNESSHPALLTAMALVLLFGFVAVTAVLLRWSDKTLCCHYEQQRRRQKLPTKTAVDIMGTLDEDGSATMMSLSLPGGKKTTSMTTKQGSPTSATEVSAADTHASDGSGGSGNGGGGTYV